VIRKDRFTEGFLGDATLRACFDASKAELLKVDGIGPKTAVAID